MTHSPSMFDQFSVTVSVSKRIVGSERLIGIPNSLAAQTHSIPNPLITHPTRNLVRPNHHPIGGKIIKTHQWTRKVKPIKIKPHWPTPIINQKTIKKKKKKPATNRSEWDWGLQLEQDRRLAAPPPPRDGRRPQGQPKMDQNPRDSRWQTRWRTPFVL